MAVVSYLPFVDGSAELRTIYNVLNYGADPSGVVDSTAAFVATIAAADAGAVNNRTSVFIPQGNFKITDELTWSSATVFFGVGPASRLFASGAGMATKYIFAGQAQATGPTFFRNLGLSNSVSVTSSGGCFKQASPLIVNLTFEGCYFQTSGDAIHADINRLFLTNVVNCKFQGIPIGGNSYGGRGVAAYTSGGYIAGCDFTNMEYAILISGAGCSMLGNRAESNWFGVMCGIGPNGDTYGLINSCIKGMQFEACGTAVDCHNANDCAFENFNTNGEFQGGPGIDSQFGLVAGGRNSYRNVIAGGEYRHSAWQMQGGPAVVENCLANNSSTGPAWDLRCPMGDVTFVGKGMSDSSNPSSLAVAYNGSLTRSLSTYRATSTMVQGKNLSGRNAVGAGATTFDVAFLVGLASQDMISSTTAGAGGALTPSTTYYYNATIITEMGEMGGHTEHSIALNGAQNRVTVVTYGIASPPGPANTTYSRRLYRGRSPDVYDGYYEQSGINGTFVDDGAAFTGLKSPPLSANGLPSGAEPDTNYSVVGVEFDWNAGAHWITGKATTGFTINWPTAAPGGGGNIAWLIAR